MVPTYNNAGTLGGVIADILNYTDNLIVINDGSTDTTPQILKQFENKIKTLTISPNQGKGNALRTGFKYAFASGYEYAITIDSDAQHFPEDLPAFLDKIAASPGALIVGDRNMNKEGIPAKSSFGNNFSNFWYKVETGIKLPDTQTGYRLYPLREIAQKRYFTKKFEFEIEVLVRAAWSGVEVTHIPIKVYYAPQNERVSHFRPFKDFTRISILNTVLVFLAFLFFRPRLWIINLKKKGFKELLSIKESNAKLAKAIGFGVFMGIVPFWGFQMLMAVTLAQILKLNKVIVLIAANISLPPLIPFIIYISLQTGVFIFPQYADVVNNLHKEIINLFEKDFNWNTFVQILGSSALVYFIGAFVLAIISGLSAGIVAFGLFKLFRNRV
ncbi:MAG: DUF2062 domain-containing protein [Bacteroidales bacterium]|nr:DUF2062 domain-containing protein [Bacteroidales bacterium]